LPTKAQSSYGSSIMHNCQVCSTLRSKYEYSEKERQFFPKGSDDGNTRDYWGFGLCPSSWICKENSVSETGSISETVCS
jgi:hypothetical protein